MKGGLDSRIDCKLESLGTRTDPENIGVVRFTKDTEHETFEHLQICKNDSQEVGARFKIVILHRQSQMFGAFSISNSNDASNCTVLRLDIFLTQFQEAKNKFVM
jgi:hypothetical protein